MIISISNTCSSLSLFFHFIAFFTRQVNYIGSGVCGEEELGTLVWVYWHVAEGAFETQVWVVALEVFGLWASWHVDDFLTVVAP